MIAPARTAAYRSLRALEQPSVDLPAALATGRTGLHDERDRALAVEIVTGTVRWQRNLDHLIEAISRRPLARIEPEVHVILRLSLYQLLHLDRVPAAAVVDDAVDLTRAARKPGASTFVNAVLRNTLRQRRKLPLPPRPDDPSDRASAIDYLGVTHSHPDWLVARWLDRYGFDATERWVRFNNESPRLTVRANTLRTGREALQAALAAGGIDAEPTRFSPDGLVILSGNPLRRPPDGTFVVQDEASQLVPLAVGALPGERVLDLCASPGGKSTALAAAMHGTGLLVASDVRPRRIRLLRDTLRATGIPQARIIQIAPTGPLPFVKTFDRVLVDAPCSGLGTLRRDPDIRWHRHEDDLQTLAGRQIALLDRASQTVRDGGRLVYATCSSEPEENDEVIHAFLASHPEFELQPLHDDLPGGLSVVLDERGILRTRPDLHGLEAFFAAAMKRRPA
jgi:16S rRNA (cytosine967-C5)-methyltransferase